MVTLRCKSFLSLLVMVVLTTHFWLGSTRPGWAIFAGVSCSSVEDTSFRSFPPSLGNFDDAAAQFLFSSPSQCIANPGTGSANGPSVNDPLGLFFNSFTANVPRDLDGFRLQHFTTVTNVTLNGTPVVGGKIDVAVPVTTSFTVQFDFAGSTFNFTVTANPDTNTLSAFTIMGGGTPTPDLDVRNSTDDAEIQDGSTTISAALGTDFGNVNVGATNSTTFRAENNGTADLTFASPAIALSGQNADQFSITTPVTNNSTLTSGNTQNFAIQFDPTSPGLKTALVTIRSDDPDEDPYTFQIQGTGVGAPEIAVVSSNGNAAVADGSTDAQGIQAAGTPVMVTYTITNSGTEELTLTDPTISNQTNVLASVSTALSSTHVAPSATSTFTVNYTPTIAGAFDFDISIGNNDADENPYDIAVSGTIPDTTAPTVQILDAPSSHDGSAPFFVTVTFSEPISGFVDGELTATNAIVGSLTPAVGGNGAAFTAIITPTSSLDVVLAVAANVAQDTSGNNNAAATQVTVIDASDVIAPQIASIRRNTPATTDGDEVSWTVTFSEPVAGFDANDVEITGVTGNPTVTVTPILDRRGSTNLDEVFKMFSFVSTAHAQGGTLATAYRVTVSGGNIANGNTAVGLQASSSFSVQDAAGNLVQNTQPTGTNESQITVVNDTDAPTVSILNAPANHDRSTPFNITVEFSEDVTNFVAGDITVANATLSNFVAVDGNTYTVDITPSGPQDITLNVAAAVAQDAAGNDNTAATQVTIVSSIVEETQQVIATFLNNRANHILSNQPSLSGFVSGENSQGGGAAGNLALNATTGSQVLAFSTSRSKILAGVRQAHARALGGIRGDHNNQLSPDTSNDPLSVFTRQKEEPSQGTNAYTQSYDLGGDTLDLQSGADLIANQRQAADAVIDDDGNALTQTSRAGTYDVWTEIYGSNTNAGTSESRLWVAYLGAHYFVDDNTLFGVLGQIDWSDETNSATGSNAEGQGWAIGPYIAGQLPGQNLFYEARASWGTSDNDVSPVGTFTDNFDTTRFLATGKVSGSIAHETYTIAPSVSVAYYEETQETYTDTLGNLIPEQTVSLGEVRFGPDISRSVELDDGTLFTPSVGVSGVFNFGIEDNAASQGFALGNDDFRARVDAGFSATNPDTGLTLSVDGFYDGIGIDDFDSYGGRVRVTVPLN